MTPCHRFHDVKFLLQWLMKEKNQRQFASFMYKIVFRRIGKCNFLLFNKFFSHLPQLVLSPRSHNQYESNHSTFFFVFFQTTKLLPVLLVCSQLPSNKKQRFMNKGRELLSLPLAEVQAPGPCRRCSSILTLAPRRPLPVTSRPQTR